MENRDYLHQEYKIKQEQHQQIIDDNVNAHVDASEGLASNSEDDDWESLSDSTIDDNAPAMDDTSNDDDDDEIKMAVASSDENLEHSYNTVTGAISVRSIDLDSSRIGRI